MKEDEVKGRQVKARKRKSEKKQREGKRESLRNGKEGEDYRRKEWRIGGKQRGEMIEGGNEVEGEEEYDDKEEKEVPREF